MKKIILSIIMLFSILLYSCSDDNNKVEFQISDNIEIELEEYNDSYNFNSYISVFYCDEIVPYSNLTISIAENEHIHLGDCKFVVSFSEGDRQYQKSFLVRFVNNYVKVKVQLLKTLTEYKVKKGDVFDSSLCKINEKHYSLEGLYLDKDYKIIYDLKSKVTSNIELFGKVVYSIDYQKGNVDSNTIEKEMNQYINQLMQDTTSYVPAWNKESFKGRWNYIDGVFLNSIVNLYYETNQQNYKDFFINYINYYIDAVGNFIHPETKEMTGYRSGELDSVCASRVLFDAYEMTKDVRYLNAIEKTYHELMDMPKAEGTNNFSHKLNYLNQIWLDGMYMYVPFLARYANLKNDLEPLNLIKTQYQYIRTHMFDEEKGLYYHGHDTTKKVFWSNQTNGNSQSFWLRSMGWFIVSLVDSIQYFPMGSARDYLTSLLKEAVEGILKYRDDKTNLFYQLIDKGPTLYVVPKEYLSGLKNKQYIENNAYVDSIIGNYLESSGSSMISYALLKASRLGYIDIKYKEIGKSIFEGIYDYSYKNGTLNYICITAGLGPESNQIRDGSPLYYLAEPVGSNDAKGVGPFLMAYLEFSKMK